MRLTALLLVVVVMHVSANSYSQTVSFSGKNVPLQTVFASFEKQTGLSFFFNYALIKDIKPVTLNVKDMPLEDALNSLLRGQGLSYYSTGKTIFIVRKEAVSAPAVSSADPTDARQVTINGKVTNAQGEGLAGASVEMKNGKKATVTDAKGAFELKNVTVGATLIITYTGYQKREIEIKDGGSYTVMLTIANNQLDQAQVIAYGTTTQRLSTGDITTVTAADIEKQPVSNPLLALEGRVPGLLITQVNGVPGTAVNVQIRGQNSYANGNDPFYVIDGVPYTSENLPGLGSILGVNGVTSNGQSVYGSPLDYINPSDIESISVLKDADATAIYGSRAANGAILITTKKGKAGKTSISVNAYSGAAVITRKVDFLNREQYLGTRREALRNDGVAPSISNGDYDLVMWDTTRYTDWQKVLIGGTAHYDDAQLSVSGGNDITQYLIGAGYHKETTVFPTNFSDQKASVHFNLSSTSADQRFRIIFTGNFVSDNNRLPTADFTANINLAPDAPPIYNKDGTLNWDSSTWSNPLAYSLNTYSNLTNNLIGNAVVSYQLLPGLSIKSSFGYTFTQQEENNTGALASVLPVFRPYLTASANFANNNLRSWIIEPQATYKTQLGGGHLEVLLGTTIEENKSIGMILNATGFTSDNLLQDIQAASMVTVGSSTNSEYRYNAVFGRLNYNLDEKYLLNLTARDDGSSRFGPANQFHTFESLGLGWIFSKEDFFQRNISFLSFGKIRASYGTTGSDQIGDYQFLDLYSPVYYNYQGIRGLSVSRLFNPNLQWEETKKAEVGLDLGLFKDRIYLTANYYLNRSANQLLGNPLPSTTGFGSVAVNQDIVVQNSGKEFVLNTVNIKSANFRWTSSINLTLHRNKLLSIGPNVLSLGPSIVGHPISEIYVYHYLGVDPATGVYQFADRKGNPTTSPDTLYVPIDLNPSYFGGLLNSFSYRGFELDVLFQFVKQKGDNNFFGNYPGSQFGNQPVTVLNRWQKPGDIKPIQRFNQNYNLYNDFETLSNSDALISDASFIRLKNLAISYQFPRKRGSKLSFQSPTVFVQGQNLFTITGYKGADPETRSFVSLPPLRVITAGLKITI